jgi:hypothetical protein
VSEARALVDEVASFRYRRVRDRLDAMGSPQITTTFMGQLAIEVLPGRRS